jgi:hypothetical protein
LTKYILLLRGNLKITSIDAALRAAVTVACLNWVFVDKASDSRLFPVDLDFREK